MILVKSCAIRCLWRGTASRRRSHFVRLVRFRNDHKPQDASAEIQRLFEQESGKPVVARASSEFSGYASIKVASTVSPAHVLLYKPGREAELPYLTAFQCGLGHAVNLD